MGGFAWGRRVADFHTHGRAAAYAVFPHVLSGNPLVFLDTRSPLSTCGDKRRAHHNRWNANFHNEARVCELFDRLRMSEMKQSVARTAYARINNSTTTRAPRPSLRTPPRSSLRAERSNLTVCRVRQNGTKRNRAADDSQPVDRNEVFDLSALRISRDNSRIQRDRRSDGEGISQPIPRFIMDPDHDGCGVKAVNWGIRSRRASARVQFGSSRVFSLAGSPAEPPIAGTQSLCEPSRVRLNECPLGEVLHADWSGAGSRDGVAIRLDS